MSVGGHALSLLIPSILFLSGGPLLAEDVLRCQAVSIAPGVDEQTGPESVRKFGARGDGRTDDTAAIQAAIDASPQIYLPPGVYLIDPMRGLRLRNGTQIVGAGRGSSVLLAKVGGGTLKQLREYGPGAIISRPFDPNGENCYVSLISLTDFSVIMTHPQEGALGSSMQIGIDLRNISRSTVANVHVGNLPAPGSQYSRILRPGYGAQGFGVVLGTVGSSLKAYSGGELNTIRDVNVWGAYKAITIDDADLSPQSAAHGTLVQRADVQHANVLLTQESRYTRGVTWADNILQNVVLSPGGGTPGIIMRVAGSDMRIVGGYVEAGPRSDILIELEPTSRRVEIDLSYVGCPKPSAVRDRGTLNRIYVNGDC